jgi:hypothetical protein
VTIPEPSRDLEGISRVHDSAMDGPEDSFDELPEDVALPGIWANVTRVRVGRDEFTIDFLRQVPGDAQRFLVARAILSPVAGIDLRDQLDEAWRDYNDWSMPTDRS